MPLPRTRLLVADDNAEWCGIIERLLEHDHEVVGAVARGDHIMEAANRLCPNLITLDVSLPGESGLLVLPRLRKACPHAIIIIVSATSTAVYREEAFLRGADGYVEKGRAFSQLATAIASVRNRISSDPSSTPFTYPAPFE